MKLKIICEKKEVGSIEVSTYPGTSHSFKFNKQSYKILTVEDTQILVELMPTKTLIDKTSQEVQVKDK